ncbi:MAG: hypothetical protein EXQ99_01375 [Alphaproteobacteria bacterium]|nr:hypothetical protein [Alphaproteobacteria bacterium]
MILLFTDFGSAGPYTGQVTAALLREAPEARVVTLISDAPTFNPRAAAYLLAALVSDIPKGAVVLGIVDPGVVGERRPIAVEAGEVWFVGPDNGLFAIAARRLGGARWHGIVWWPERLSATFHGRDLFAPVAARLSHGELPANKPLKETEVVGHDWPDDLAEVIYVDPYGNVMTGLRAGTLSTDLSIVAGGSMVRHARTFSAVGVGLPFWYENANGLCEVAVNQGRADEMLGLQIGLDVQLVTGRHG